MLQARQLGYVIGGKRLLNELNFEIAAGDFVAVMGPNGSGKTTLLKIFSGVYRDYLGGANLHWLQIKRLKPMGLARSIAVVPQEAYFAFDFSVFEVVLMGRYVHRSLFGWDSEADLQVAQTVMEACEVWSFKDRRINSLSGGEKQRVLLARALVQKTPILLLDEPSSHLDLRHRQQIFERLGQLNRRDRMTILCVVHDPNIALGCMNKVLLLDQGCQVAFGDTQSVLTDQRLKQVFQVDWQRVELAERRYFFLPSTQRSSQP